MTPQEFDKFYPLIAGWLRSTLTVHSSAARSVASCGFPRLPLYFSVETLALANVVLVDRLPIPPLSSWGLVRVVDLERSDPAAIAYLDPFFLKRHKSKNEAIHFHELIHVIQWRVLGPENFLRSYADGLERFGYGENPLEVLAYDGEKRFVTSSAGFDAEQFVVENL